MVKPPFTFFDVDVVFLSWEFYASNMVLARSFYAFQDVGSLNFGAYCGIIDIPNNIWGNATNPNGDGGRSYCCHDPKDGNNCGGHSYLYKCDPQTYATKLCNDGLGTKFEYINNENDPLKGNIFLGVCPAAEGWRPACESALTSEHPCEINETRGSTFQASGADDTGSYTNSCHTMLSGTRNCDGNQCVSCVKRQLSCSKCACTNPVCTRCC